VSDDQELAHTDRTVLRHKSALFRIGHFLGEEILNT